MVETTRQRINAALAFLDRLSDVPLAVHPQVIHRLSDEKHQVATGLKAELRALDIDEAVTAVGFETWLEQRLPNGQLRKNVLSVPEVDAARSAWMAAQEKPLRRHAQEVSAQDTAQLLAA